MITAEDKLEILDLIGQYSHAADGEYGPEPEHWANVYTDDGIFHGRAGQPDEVIARGRDGLMQFATRSRQRGGGNVPRLVQTRHHQSTTVFLETGIDRVVTRTYLMATGVTEGGRPQIGLTTIYEDEIVRTPKGWKIKYRKLIPDVKGVLRDIVRT